MFLQIYIFFTLLFVSVISSEWKNFPNKCNSTCLNENLKQTINDSDCLPWDQWPKILKPKNFTISGKQCISLNEESPIHVCPKMINGKKMLASCGDSFNDFRISCIPTAPDSEDEKDSFEWYRGIKSTTFNGTKCLRWDEIDFIGNKFSAFFDFTETSFGSHTFGIHSHENFCRNPDKWSAGPWCYIKGGKVPVRQPCFNQCKRSEEKFLATPEASLNPCLSRLFFLSIFSLKNLPTANFYLSNLPMKNRPKWISQYLIQNTQYLNSKFCYFRDSRANYFGPWTFKPSPSDIQFRSYQTFANDSDLHGDSWERCYFSCEDLVLKCLPSIKFNYFGPKQITVDGTQCISPNILANRLQETFAKFNNNETNFKMYKPELWQFWKLFTSDKLGNVENLFFKNSVDRLLNPQCYNFRLFISKIDFLEFSALKQIFQNGVGCFIAKPENEIQLTSVIFEPCFIQCPPNTSEPIFSIEPVLFENETYHTTIFEEKQIHSGNFEDKLDRGDSTATIILLTFSCLSLIAAIIICILHAFNKI